MIIHTGAEACANNYKTLSVARKRLGKNADRVSGVKGPYCRDIDYSRKPPSFQCKLCQPPPPKYFFFLKIDNYPNISTEDQYYDHNEVRFSKKIGFFFSFPLKEVSVHLSKLPCSDCHINIISSRLFLFSVSRLTMSD